MEQLSINIYGNYNVELYHLILTDKGELWCYCIQIIIKCRPNKNSVEDDGNTTCEENYLNVVCTTWFNNICHISHSCNYYFMW